MRETIPNVQLRAWREAQNLTRAEMADRLNRTKSAQDNRLVCDEERIGRWERGEVLWPRAAYRQALHDLTQRPADELGFVSPGNQTSHHLVEASMMPGEAMRAEAELFDTMDLTHMAAASDVGSGTLEAIEEAVDLLCRAYPSTPPATLRDRTKQRLKYVMGLLEGRVTLFQHRELLVHAGWLAALLGCVHEDVGDREQAEAARQAAYQMGKQAGHGELMGWAWEMSAWFALAEGRFEDVVDAAQKGQAVAGTSSGMVQLTLQEAKGQARLGDAKQAGEALHRGAEILGQLPTPTRPEHHFVFDHTKWIFYAATVYAWLGDDQRSEEHATEVIARHTRPDGTTNAPMRTANARIDLAIVHARRGDLDAAVETGSSAFGFERKSLTDLVHRGEDLDHILRTRYGNERPAKEFHERLVAARRALRDRRPDVIE